MIIKRKLFAKISGTPKKIRDVQYVVSKKIFPKKSHRKLAEKAIKSGRTVEAIENYTRTHTPGQALADGIGVVAKNPAATGTWAATSLLPVPSTLLSVAAEKGARKIPAYAKATDKIQARYDRGNVKRTIESIGNSIAMIPI